MDGFETAALIRERKRSEHTPIIFITAFNDDVHIAKGYSLGAVDFISTPIDPDVLRTKVGVFVDLYQKTETIRQQAAHRVQLAREQAARQVAEKAMRRSALLAEASRLLSRSLDFDATLASLHRTWCRRWPTPVNSCSYDPNGGYLVRTTYRSTSRPRTMANSELARPHRAGSAATWLEPVREAIESGHAQPIPIEALCNAPDLGAKTQVVERDRRAARCPRHAARCDRVLLAGRAAAVRAGRRRPASKTWPAGPRRRSTTPSCTRRFATANGARTSSWRCSATNCEIRWRRSPTPAS